MISLWFYYINFKNFFSLSSFSILLVIPLLLNSSFLLKFLPQLLWSFPFLFFNFCSLKKNLFYVIKITMYT